MSTHIPEAWLAAGPGAADGDCSAFGMAVAGDTLVTGELIGLAGSVLTLDTVDETGISIGDASGDDPGGASAEGSAVGVGGSSNEAPGTSSA